VATTQSPMTQLSSSCVFMATGISMYLCFSFGEELCLMLFEIEVFVCTFCEVKTGGRSCDIVSKRGFLHLLRVLALLIGS
jgi:hypothetical protein